jgi:hypothetical protein
MNCQLTSTPEYQQNLNALASWCRLRMMDYAKKKGLTYNQALNSLFRKNKAEQIKELDSVVDEKYHSSQEPKFQLLQSNRVA